MFDIGFWELTIIGVVALVVIGPERLPGVARTVGVWVGKARNFASTVKTDISNEVGRSEELAKLLEEQNKLKDMHEIIEQTVNETRKTVAVGNDQFQAPKHEAKPLGSIFDDEDVTGEIKDVSSNSSPDTLSGNESDTGLENGSDNRSNKSIDNSTDKKPSPRSVSQKQ